MQPHLFIILLVGGALVLLCMWAALRAARMRRYMLDTPTSKCEGVFVGDVELQGTAESDTPVHSYLAEIACVHYTWEVSEHWERTVVETYRDEKGNTRTRTRTESGSTTIASGGEQLPFYLSDGTGHVLIRPDGASVETVTVVSEYCSPGDPLYYGKGPRGAIADSTHRRTFREEAIPLHHEIFVMGRARERQDMVAAEIAADRDARIFLISVRKEAEIGRGYAWGAWLWGIFGAVILLAAFLILANENSLSNGARLLGSIATVVGYIALYAFFWTWALYNSLTTLRERVRRAWSNIDVELKRRCDLLPNLAASVKGLRDHEAETQKVIALLRSQAALAATDVRGGGARVVGLTPLFTALAERYPELVAQQGFLKLQEELVRTENRIALSRTYYNGIATAFNARIAGFPHMLLAMLAGLRAFPMFEATRLERQSERVSFAE